MQNYLKQALTPIVEYVFNENRSIRNLFSAIDYAPLVKVNEKQNQLLHYPIIYSSRIVKDVY